MTKDSNPELIGIWKKEEILSERDFDIFFIWLNAKNPKTGFSIEKRLGKAEIYDFELTTDRIRFKKQYSQTAINSGGMKSCIEYQGRVSKTNRCYFGNWKNGEQRGYFALTTYDPPEIKEIYLKEMLLESEIRVLAQRVIERRMEFPFLPLDKIDFW